MCWFAFCFGWVLTVYPTSGLAFRGALWADSAHTNQGVQWKGKMRCPTLRSDLNHLSSECCTAPRGERKAVKMKRASSKVPCGSDLLIISMILVDFVQRYSFFLAETAEHQSDRTPWQLSFSYGLFTLPYRELVGDRENLRCKCLKLHWALSFNVVVHLQ